MQAFSRENIGGLAHENFNKFSKGSSIPNENSTNSQKSAQYQMKIQHILKSQLNTIWY